MISIIPTNQEAEFVIKVDRRNLGYKVMNKESVFKVGFIFVRVNNNNKPLNTEL